MLKFVVVACLCAAVLVEGRSSFAQGSPEGPPSGPPPGGPPPPKFEYNSRVVRQAPEDGQSKSATDFGANGGFGASVNFGLSSNPMDFAMKAQEVARSMMRFKRSPQISPPQPPMPPMPVPMPMPGK